MTSNAAGKRILVTGGAGFIGSHLCTELVEEGADVICLDNFFTGRKVNIQHLLNKPNFDLVRHDVHQPIYCEVDEIYHLACPASPVHYQLHPVETITTSVQGAINVLDLAHRKGAKVLLASTSEVYGDPLVHPQTEDYYGNVNTVGPRSCYDEGKRCAETLFADYNRQFGVDIRIARIFNTYGPNLNHGDGRVVSNFIVQALNGEDITLYGDGSQTRSFCYVSDLVRGLRMLMDSKDVSVPVNIGNPVEFTVKELAELVLAKTDTPSQIIQKLPLPTNDPTQRQPNITRAQELLGWEPKVPLEEGLNYTIAYFQRIMDSGIHMKAALQKVA